MSLEELIASGRAMTVSIADEEASGFTEPRRPGAEGLAYSKRTNQPD